MESCGTKEINVDSSINENSLNKNEPVREKKKRGRKPKVLTDEEKKQKDSEPRVRKRGRKPKYPIESISEIREKFQNNDKVIFSSSTEPVTVEDEYNKTQVSFGNLNITISETPEIDKEELRSMFHKQTEELRKKNKQRKVHKPILEEETKIDIEPPIIPEITQDVFKSNPPPNVEENDDDVYEYNKVEKKRVYKQLYKFREKYKEAKKWPEKTNILCWWCCHSFDTIPIPSVVKYDYITKKYHLKGIFCSWECSKAYTLTNSKNTSYLYRLYRDWTGDYKFDIKSAPSRIVLKCFGGYMDIDEYRSSSQQDRKISISSDFNMDYVNQEILEVYKTLEKKKKTNFNFG